VPIAKPRTITFFVDTKSPLKRMGNRIQINAHMVLVNEKIKKGCVTSPQCIYNIFKKKIGISVVFFWRELEEPKLLQKILFKGKVINKTNRTRS